MTSASASLHSIIARTVYTTHVHTERMRLNNICPSIPSVPRLFVQSVLSADASGSGVADFRCQSKCTFVVHLDQTSQQNKTSRKTKPSKGKKKNKQVVIQEESAYAVKCQHSSAAVECYTVKSGSQTQSQNAVERHAEVQQ